MGSSTILDYEVDTRLEPTALNLGQANILPTELTTSIPYSSTISLALPALVRPICAKILINDNIILFILQNSPLIILIPVLIL